MFALLMNVLEMSMNELGATGTPIPTSSSMSNVTLMTGSPVLRLVNVPMTASAPPSTPPALPPGSVNWALQPLSS